MKTEKEVKCTVCRRVQILGKLVCTGSFVRTSRVVRLHVLGLRNATQGSALDGPAAISFELDHLSHPYPQP